MRGSRVRELTPAALAELPPTCTQCPLGDRVTVTSDTTWAHAAHRRWGLCGVSLVTPTGAGRTVTGYLLVSPALNVPRSHPLATCPAEPERAVLMGARFLDGADESVVGHRLVQALAARLVSHPATRSIGAVASLVPACTTPGADWLAAVGFHETEERPQLSTWQLDLDASVGWRTRVDDALERMAGLIPRPTAPPEPAGPLLQASGAKAGRPRRYERSA